MLEYLKALEDAEKMMNEIDTRWESDPENKELESLWDLAYKAEHEAFEAAVAALSRYTRNMISVKTARSMLKIKRKEVVKLFEIYV